MESDLVQGYRDGRDLRSPPPSANRWVGVKVTTRRARDFFRLRYWVRCWHCELCRGPYLSEAEQVENLYHRCPDREANR